MYQLVRIMLPTSSGRRLTSIVSGVGNSKFNPDSEITREQIAKILYSYIVEIGTDTIFAMTGKAVYESYGDYTTVSDYATNGMRWCVQENVLNGSVMKMVATCARVAVP